MSLSRKWRILVQSLTLLGFCWLFLQTEYRGTDELAYPVSLLFRLDPLALVSAFFASGKTDFILLWPAFLLLVLTIIFGRFFCGWLCPLGSLLDFLGAPLRRSQSRFSGWPKFKYYLLSALTLASLCGLQLFGLFDPLSIFLRSLTLAINPVWNLLANTTFDWLYQAKLPLISSTADVVYPFFRDHLLAFRQPVFLLTILTAFVFLAVILLERLQPRFWCRNLCPLGALLGLCSQPSRLQRTPQSDCSDCKQCSLQCYMGASAADSSHAAECIRCLDCLDFCPNQRVKFHFSKRGEKRFDLSRRTLLAASVGGVMLAPLAAAAPLSASYRNDLIRPPGATGESEFLRRCIRCGECMKVCIGGALHPDLLRGGAFSLWSPVVVARLGYCEYDCTLCGQVCPTGAIKSLEIKQKRQIKIGLAVIDKNRCLPFARGQECLVCEEHCPTGKKAITFDRHKDLVESEARDLLQPRVLKELCIGCGICETRCPVAGRSAIMIISEGESRAPQGLL
ncbi:4Fe-4S binding protein [Geopsychrobacter electrodiphilus]|uniref:4Fe-4S binding protein n=1 Tax=Geopsychrobacter electrodiphilus TaxID=225196 RepID=UPI00037880F0|nr:4Fe-4S binding protein [Geopsychrobacter electrodiphilus]